MAASLEIERLRRRLDEEPADDDARAALAALLATHGDPVAAAEAFYLAACGARRRGQELLFDARLRACLEADPTYPLLFTGPPAPAGAPDDVWARILVVHPESRVRGPLVRLLADHGYIVDAAPTVGSARAAIRQTPPDLVLTAPVFVDGTAAAVASAARKARGDAAVILLTCAAKGDPGGAAAPGFDERVDRPLAPERLLEATKSALSRHHAPAGGAPLPPLARPDRAAIAAALPRVLLLVAAGYVVILSLHSFLQSTFEAIHPPPPPPVRQAEWTPSPTPLGVEAERNLWLRLTSFQSEGGVEVSVTALVPALLAARAARAGSPPPPPTPELATFEVHVEAGGDLDLDPEAVAGSLRLSAGIDRRAAPEHVPPLAEMRIVRESRPGQSPRVRSLTFVASFPRTAIAGAEVFALSLEAGGRPVTVYVATPGDAR